MRLETDYIPNVEAGKAYLEGEPVDADGRDIVDTAFGWLRLEADEAYDSGEERAEEVATEVLYEVAGPLLSEHHDFRETDGINTDVTHLLEDRYVDEIETAASQYDFYPSKNTVREFYDELRTEYREDEFDYVFGIAHGGTPLMIASSNHFDAPTIPFRLSRYNRMDQEPKWMNIQTEDLNLENANVLVVDDVSNQNVTMQNALNHMRSQGASSEGVTARKVGAEDRSKYLFKFD